ncbi:olfactory receptor 1-like [Boleophthalmus pectinirostris]|uniref:olfactory receptor 1-like n=1 Tax=Boleophthalmus pectinirostris TaxID=150288 RepID=UPI000A1C6289|nr:olfactory receptor 1-like [Boleophthalmus pectinirostris]
MENSTLLHVRPAKFYINGFFSFPQGTYFYIFMWFVYLATVFGNIVLLLIILLVRALHTPKYMVVFNLALTDLCGSTSLIPKLLDTFLFENRYIEFKACLSYMFFVLFFSSMQSWTLAIMSFDRFIAICFPLQYHSVVTKPVVVLMLLFVWLISLCILGTVVGLIDHLSFCKSLVIQSYYCDHESLYHIACNSALVNQQFVMFGGVVIFLIPLSLIGCSYVNIAIVLKKTSVGARVKAIKTCTSHLMLVAIFFIPLITAKTAVHLPNFNPNTRMTNFVLSQTIPSLLNPFVYSLKTEEMRNVIKHICGRCKPKIIQ